MHIPYRCLKNRGGLLWFKPAARRPCAARATQRLTPNKLTKRHNGNAPLPVWSSNKQRHRLSRSGDRQLSALDELRYEVGHADDLGIWRPSTGAAFADLPYVNPVLPMVAIRKPSGCSVPRNR
jgi:hypothetical protein